MSKSVELLAGAEDSEQIQAGECVNRPNEFLLPFFDQRLLLINWNRKDRSKDHFNFNIEFWNCLLDE